LPGRNARDALQRFLTPLQQDISCISNDVLIVSPGGRRSGAVRSLTLANGPILLNDDGLYLDVGMQYDIIRTDEPEKGPYKCRTRAYDYALRDDEGNVALAYHWHPLGNSTYHDPHFHFPPQWPGIHFPCQRTSLESVIRLCIQELGVEPDRDDWSDVLALNEGVFQLWRSWSMRPDLAKEVIR